MNVSFISQWYAPELGDGGPPRSIARALRDRDYTVDVLTGFPNYPAGELYPGYRLRLYQREVLDGVPVHRAPLYISHDAHPIRRAANYLSFAGAGSAVALTALPRSDATLVYSSPITAALPAMALRARRGTPYVLFVQDMWPQSVTASSFGEASGMQRMEHRLHRLCDAIYRRAAHIAVTSPGMADLIAARNVPRDKISFVPNWADESNYYRADPDPGLRQELGITSPFTVMYAGNLGDVQGLDAVVDAAALLRDNESIGFVLLGFGTAAARLQHRIDELRLVNIRILHPRRPSDMARVLALGDVQLVSLKDAPLFRSTIPSKVQSLMAAGRPIIGCVAGDASEIITQSGAGLAVPPESSGRLADAVLKISREGVGRLAQRGGLGREYYLSEFSAAVGGRRLDDILRRVAAQPRSGLKIAQQAGAG